MLSHLAQAITKYPVDIVNQFTGVDPARDMFDDIHPNTNGEKIMAERWFNAIKPYLQKLSPYVFVAYGLLTELNIDSCKTVTSKYAKCYPQAYFPE